MNQLARSNSNTHVGGERGRVTFAPDAFHTGVKPGVAAYFARTGPSGRGSPRLYLCTNLPGADEDIG